MQSCLVVFCICLVLYVFLIFHALLSIAYLFLLPLEHVLLPSEVSPIHPP